MSYQNIDGFTHVCGWPDWKPGDPCTACAANEELRVAEVRLRFDSCTREQRLTVFGDSAWGRKCFPRDYAE